MAYRALDAERIERTIERLSQRVELRFPGSGLAGVVSELLGVARHTAQTVEWIGKPLVPLRVGIALLGLIILGGLVVSLSSLQVQAGPPGASISTTRTPWQERGWMNATGPSAPRRGALSMSTIPCRASRSSSAARSSTSRQTW